MAQQVFTNRYEIRQHLARGGMAEVYLARDLLLDRPVALKVLYPELSADSSFVERFRREAQAAANLNQPNIVDIYDWGEEGNTYFIVMEYVEGNTLRDIIRSVHRLHPHRAADVGADIAAALAFAHQNGVIHRDVKPGNVLVTSNGQVKVTDFGIARAVRDGAQENLTQTGTVMGTATYFSPEQAQGQSIDARSDLYALGVVLYEMVTGRPPFMGDNPVAIAYQHVREEPIPPTKRNPDVPADLETIILKALAKDPNHRYQSADELRADLTRFRRGETVLARPLVSLPATAAVPPVSAAETTRVQQAYADHTQVQPAVARPAPPAELPPPPPQGRSTGTYAALLLGMLAVLGLLLFLLGRQLGVVGGGGENGAVTMPDLRGRQVEEATQLLRQQGLRSTTKEEENERFEEGVVFAQEPAPGVSLSRGDRVVLSVSAGPPKARVPNVKGQKLADANEALVAVGLESTVNQVPSDDVPADEVIDQDPSPGTQLRQGQSVALTVSAGPEETAVPDVSGKTEIEAANILGQEGFQVGPTRQEPSDDVEAGQVTRTSPAAGTKAPEGSVVTIYVSSGQSQATVPDVVGLTEDQARSQLTSAGFNVGVRYRESERQNEGRVVAQEPRRDTEAERGSTVVIIVGRTSETNPGGGGRDGGGGGLLG